MKESYTYTQKNEMKFANVVMENCGPLISLVCLRLIFAVEIWRVSLNNWTDENIQQKERKENQRMINVDTTQCSHIAS